MRHLLGLLALLVFTACRSQSAHQETPAAIVVTHETLEFGVVPVMESKGLWLELQNKTNTALHLTSADVRDHAAFSVNLESREIPAFQTLRLLVEFHPQVRGAQQTTLTVLTDSPATPGLTATLRGTGVGPAVVLQTTDLDFGTVLVGKQKTLQILFTNQGTVAEEVTVTDPSSVSAFFTSGSSTGKLQIGPKETLQVPVTFVAFEATKDPLQITLPVRLCADCNTSEITLRAKAMDSFLETRPDQLVFDRSVPSSAPGKGRLPVTLLNNGEAPITINTVEILSGGDWASVDKTGPITLLAHTQEIVNVTANIDGLAHEGMLKLTTDDARRPEVLIKLIAPEISPDACLLLAPDEVNFGTTESSCPLQSRSVVVYNSCVWPLSLSKVSLANAGNAFRFIAPPLPRAVMSNSPARIDIEFSPMAAGTYSATLNLEVNDRAVQYPIALYGVAKTQPPIVDTFQQPQRPKSDVLFVIDDSPSMASYQQSLESNLLSYKQYLDSLSLDVNLAVTTMDVSNTGERGRFVPVDGSRLKVVNDQTPNGVTLFHDNANVGFAGSTTQHGLEAMSLALSPTLLAGDNAGFLRPDAFLSVILISASPEASAGVVNDYIGPLWALKGPRNANMVSISTVSVQTPTNDRYAEAAKTTGGISTSIDRSDWEKSFHTIVLAASGQRTRFYLSSVPRDPAVIEVKVDGQVVPATGIWSYTSASNSIDFLPTAIPPPGSKIEISYDPACR